MDDLPSRFDGGMPLPMDLPTLDALHKTLPDRGVIDHVVLPIVVCVRMS